MNFKCAPDLTEFIHIQIQEKEKILRIYNITRMSKGQIKRQIDQIKEGNFTLQRERDESNKGLSNLKLKV